MVVRAKRNEIFINNGRIISSPTSKISKFSPKPVGTGVLDGPFKQNDIFIDGTPRVSLRLGRALVLTTHRVVIHYARVATLRRSLQSIKVTPTPQVLPKLSLH